MHTDTPEKGCCNGRPWSLYSGAPDHLEPATTGIDKLPVYWPHKIISLPRYRPCVTGLTRTCGDEGWDSSPPSTNTCFTVCYCVPASALLPTFPCCLALRVQETVRAIIDAAAMPLSILIVGIGREDFGNMHVSGACVCQQCRSTGIHVAQC